MKKLSALLLTFIMVISLITIPASANATAVTFDALTDATNYFYDNGGAANEALYDNLMLRPGEWASYDVSGLEGTYEVSITYIQNQGNGSYFGFIEYSIDDEWQLTSKHLLTEGVAWNGTAVSSGALGNVVIGADSKYLKVKNSGRFNAAIDKITLTPVENATAAPVKLYGENITSTAQSGAVVAGTDHYDAAGSTFAADFNTVRNLSGVNYLALHNGDWTRFDISGLKAGDYNLSLNYINYAGVGKTATLTLKVDGTQVLSKTIARQTSAATLELGSVTIAKGAKYLVAEVTVQDTNALYIDSFNFTRESTEAGVAGDETITAPTDVTTTNGTVTEGTDYHDAAGSTFAADFNTVRNLSGVDYLALHSGDWVRYDISNWGAGTYNVGMNYINYAGVGKTATLTLKVDGTQVLSKTIARQTSAATLELGSVTIAKGAKYLVAEVTVQDTNALYIDSFNFISEVVEGGATGDKAITAPTDVTTTNGTVTEGTDYHDAAGVAFGTAVQSIRDFSGIDYLALHSGDWVRYDISNWSAGTYNLGMNYINYAGVGKITTLTLKVDGVTVITKEIGRQTSAAILDLGSITISDNANYLVVEVTAQDTNALYIEKFDAAFEALPVIDISFEAFGKGGTKIDSIEGLTKAYAVINLSKEAEALGVKVYVAVYEGDEFKTMKDMTPLDASNVSSYKNVVTLNNLNANSEVKVFVWDAETFEPITAASVISQDAPPV